MPYVVLYHWVDFCYDSGILTSILVYPSFEEKYGLYTENSAGYAVVSVSLAASFVASLISGFIADGIGRKIFLMIASIIHTIGCIIEVAGQSQASFFAGRIISGLAIGILSMLVPLYQSEIAKPQNRGRLVTVFQIFITLGFCVAFWIGYGTYHIEGEKSWRIPLGIQIIPGGLLFLGIYFVPESPRWLIYKDRQTEALEILAQLRSHGMGVHIFSQLSGINAILFYFPYILESAGVTGTYSALLSNGIGGLVNFIATLFVIIYVSMAICMITITVVSAVFDQDLIKPMSHYNINLESAIRDIRASYSIIVLLCIFIALFALSWGPIGWIYPAEIYPQMIRANAMGITTSCSYLFNLFIALIAPVMFEDIGWRTYVFFTCMCLVMALVIHLFYPETKGRSLEEIQLIFSGALVDQRPDAHHPSTAAEALIQLEHIKHQQQRERLAKQNIDTPLEWIASASSPPHPIEKSINNNHSFIELSSNVNRSLSERSL
ncbi:hypothetical protein RO3G_11676 [Rhizopus delemar RA 99-880]|uniref:Major facilitator superfamily (MFS) profile domain-containing protein n=1 Tax=Rhizopus delemar (strain RA 99-880 / ATCC MYA-4621 / FGSC 9543 / NRRL 43880) TaxID=246409 RepID=I1CET5_RHIO9|nr:hypothetical protein RO3G_11676 [Rhizopus delemar RA 99-880]|eukprot:EIE86965.1 hypothetical protein RO3G_11676 [Rhizopus delemar RA 99-880]